MGHPSSDARYNGGAVLPPGIHINTLFKQQSGDIGVPMSRYYVQWDLSNAVLDIGVRIVLEEFLCDLRVAFSCCAMQCSTAIKSIPGIRICTMTE